MVCVCVCVPGTALACVTLVLRAVIRTMGAEEEVLNAVTGVEIFHSLHLITLLREREKEREREVFAQDETRSETS